VSAAAVEENNDVHEDVALGDMVATIHVHKSGTRSLSFCRYGRGENDRYAQYSVHLTEADVMALRGLLALGLVRGSERVIVDGRSAGSKDAWTTQNCDPRGRFIETPYEETDWPAFRDAYNASFDEALRTRKGGAK
jgi:hypothetical protein